MIPITMGFVGMLTRKCTYIAGAALFYLNASGAPAIELTTSLAPVHFHASQCAPGPLSVVTALKSRWCRE